MDGHNLLVSDGTALVDGLTNDIDDSAESFGTNRHLNGVSSVEHGLTANETLGGVEGDGTHVVASQMLGHFEHETVLGALDLKGVENGREFAFELHVHDGTDHLGNLTSGGAEGAYYINQSQSLCK